MSLSDQQLSCLLNQCPMPRVMTIVGERWSFLILRLAFSGIQHFDQFQAILGIARNILSDRLAKLVEHGVLERVPSSDDRRRVNYCLTPKGEALLPALVALRQWGERWETDVPAKPIIADKLTGRRLPPIVIRSADGRTLGLGDLCWVEEAEEPVS